MLMSSDLYLPLQPSLLKRQKRKVGNPINAGNKKVIIFASIIEVKAESDISVTLTGQNLDTVWENLLIQVGNVTMEPGRTLDEQLAVDERRAKLQKQIEQLERKARAEKQPKKKFELHQQIQNLRKEIEISGYY